MSIENHIESVYRKLFVKKYINEEFLPLYKDVKSGRLKTIFSSIHKGFEEFFTKMNERLPTGENSDHFWAHESRELLFFIEIAIGLHRVLKESSYLFMLDNYYLELIIQCRSFLQSSGGSTLPPHMEEVTIYYIDPIFIPIESKEIKRSGDKSRVGLKLIGEGSYALVYKFKDNLYEKFFILKRAKNNLNQKELGRFKIEFDEMKKLSSPYILEVHSFDIENNEYVMEYMEGLNANPNNRFKNIDEIINEVREL